MGKFIGRCLIALLILTALYFKLSGGEVKKEAQQEESPSQVTDEELEDAKEFAVYVIQNKGYTCDKVTTFSTANFSGRADVWCDGQYQYEITKPGGNWKVEVVN